MTWEILLPLRPGKKQTEKLKDRDVLPIAGRESNKQMLNPVKLTFFRHPVERLVLANLEIATNNDIRSSELGDF